MSKQCILEDKRIMPEEPPESKQKINKDSVSSILNWKKYKFEISHYSFRNLRQCNARIK